MRGIVVWEVPGHVDISIIVVIIINVINTSMTFDSREGNINVSIAYYSANERLSSVCAVCSYISKSNNIGSKSNNTSGSVTTKSIRGCAQSCYL